VLIDRVMRIGERLRAAALEPPAAAAPVIHNVRPAAPSIPHLKIRKQPQPEPTPPSQMVGIYTGADSTATLIADEERAGCD
jgi:hypothetical protein